MSTDTSHQPARERMLQVAKQLFAERGYENTSTVAIARAAGSSESQLMKHFGSKEGLLESVFDQGWSILTERLGDLDSLRDGRQKIEQLVGAMLVALEADPVLKDLLLLEGRRIRKEGHMILMTRGFLQIVGTLDRILNEMRTQGELGPGLNPQAVRSALIGSVEGMLRDQVLAKRTGYPAAYSLEEVREIFRRALAAFLVPR
ncbi:MAG TPA: TetR/AcrR family transcriptional regulator [Terriglobales bacterium]|nr:TetR/AcrR family transcriptional regulator [Terriglobales bacterium]